MGVCGCPVFCCTLLCFHSGDAVVLVGKRELVALLSLSSCCLVVVRRLFLAVPWGCLRFVIVVFPDHTHLKNVFFKSFSVRIRSQMYGHLHVLHFILYLTFTASLYDGKTCLLSYGIGEINKQAHSLHS